MNTRLRKQTVESCLTIGPPRGLLRDTEGAWNWSRYGWVIHYRVFACSSSLHLSFDHGLVVEQDIQLDRTEPYYGGTRWWFLCPTCSRRVLRLHLPSHAYYFSCRQCFDLSYESAQSSRTKSERFFKDIARQLECTTRVARLWFRVAYGGVAPEIKRPAIEKVRDRRSGIALLITKQARTKGLSV